MRKLVCALAAVASVTLITVRAQAPLARPAFPGQTNAPPPATPSPAFTIETVTTRLSGPWCVAFLPDGNFLVTESAGSMRIVRPDGVVSAPLAGVPGVKVVAAQGLHDVVLDPDFARNRALYLTYFAPPRGEAPAIWPNEFFYDKVWTKSLAERRTMAIGMERVARARLSDDNRSLLDVEVILDGGGERRMVLAPDGTLLVAGADRFRFYDSDLDGVEHDFTDNPDIRRNFSGRVVRINRDGSIPKDNRGSAGQRYLPETFAHGLRDPEGAAINPSTGELWVADHGPQGGDEINIIRAGRDYGWPDVSYGRQYDARRTDGRKNVPVGNGAASMKGVEEPIYFWDPDIGTSGMMFYTGTLFPAWKGNLFVGGLPAQYLARLVLNGERVVSEEKLLTQLKQRIRDVRQGPDGTIYVLAGNGLLRLRPK